MREERVLVNKEEIYQERWNIVYPKCTKAKRTERASMAKNGGFFVASRSLYVRTK